MSHSVRRHLGLEIDAYDATIRRFIPGYETMLAVAADAVAAAAPERVCDLGAGTGALAEAVLERCAATVELLDVDTEMMEQARRRLDRFGDRVRYELRSYDEPFAAPVDAFAASLSLHHLPTIEAKERLFARAFDAMRPGGVLVNADANMPEDPAARERLFRHWADHLIGSGISEARAWRHFEDWAEEDTYLPVDAELEALVRAGFAAEQVWRDGPIGVVVAKKAPDATRPASDRPQDPPRGG